MKKLLILALKYTFIISFAFAFLIYLINIFSTERYKETKKCDVIFSISKEDNKVLNTFVKEDTCHAK